MVFQERVAMIVTLVHKVPGDCALYFPTKVGQTKKYGKMTVTLKSDEKEQSYIMRRDFLVLDTSADAVSTDGFLVSHYHF